MSQAHATLVEAQDRLATIQNPTPTPTATPASARAALDATVLRAPMPGTVASVSAQVGDSIGESSSTGTATGGFVVLAQLSHLNTPWRRCSRRPTSRPPRTRPRRRARCRSRRSSCVPSCHGSAAAGGEAAPAAGVARGGGDAAGRDGPGLARGPPLRAADRDADGISSVSGSTLSVQGPNGTTKVELSSRRRLRAPRRAPWATCARVRPWSCPARAARARRRASSSCRCSNNASVRRPSHPGTAPWRASAPRTPPATRRRSA